VWNIPGTIALRYFFAFILLSIVIVSKVDWGLFFRNNQLLLLLFLYLVFQLLFFSSDFYLAIHNFKSEWLKFILFALTGIGCGYLINLFKFPRMNLYLGFLFAIPLIIHLILCVIKGFQLGKVPMGYWGINKTHGDLAYTSIHAAIFLSVFLLLQAKTSIDKLITLLLLSACILSPLIASSRGGTFFAFISIATVAVFTAILRRHFKQSINQIIIVIIGFCLLIFCIYKVGVSLDPNRWNSTLSRLEMGFKGDALQINCEGVEVLENLLREDGTSITPEISRILDSIKDGDGARVLAARSAIQLIPNNFMGINQSKIGYDLALEKACGHLPKIELLNSHNGWLDSALSIGVIGAILYLLVCCNFMRLGIKSSFNDIKTNAPSGVALFALSFLWITRSIFDSSQRDQMLEMQIFTLCLLSSSLLFYTESKSD
jgi:hypothetical protein